MRTAAASKARPAGASNGAPPVVGSDDAAFAALPFALPVLPASAALDPCPSRFAIAADDIRPHALEAGRGDVGVPTFTICS